MKEKKKKAQTKRDEYLIKADADANVFNLRAIGALTVITVVIIVLNELGIFTAPRTVLIVASISAFVVYTIPLLIYFINRLRKPGERVVEQDWFQVLIIVSAFIGTAIFCVSLTLHAVLLIAVPALMAAQYREHKKSFILVSVATALLVPLGVYGGFLFGMTDRNFFKNMLTDEEALVFANRLALLTPQRALELFTHYTLPRLLVVIAIDILVYGIIHRNRKMLDGQLALSKKVQEELESRRRMQDHVIESLANLIEERDTSTGEHIFRTRQYVGMIAGAMKNDEKYRELITDEFIERIKSAAPLHDVGKITVPDRILLKPGKLTPEEFEVMKTHAPSGGKIIEKLFVDMDDTAFLKMAEEIASAHHERWDGTGYPQGLKGENIPLSARIMAVADVFDALVSVRVYKGAIRAEDALNILYEESGTHFDPDIIRIVRTISDEMIAASRSSISFS